MARIVYAVLGVLALICSFALCGLIGALIGEAGCKQRRFDYEKEAIAPVLNADPAFAKLELDMLTVDGSALIFGSVPTQADLDRLRPKIRDLLGSARIEDPLIGVSVDR